jgi:hypothetical protein
MDEYFIVEYCKNGSIEIDAFESDDEAKDKIKKLFEDGNEFGIKLHHCTVNTTYRAEHDIKYVQVTVASRES